MYRWRTFPWTLQETEHSLPEKQMDSPSFTIPLLGADVPPPPPDILTFADIETDHVVLLAKETADGTALRTIGTMSVLGMKPVFVDWYAKGCPNAFPVYSAKITPPPVCSDGIVRSLADYIVFCSGSTIQEHIALFQAKLPDIQVSYANLRGDVSVVVSKAGT